MEYIYDDGGRLAAGFRGKAGDCVVRAVAIALEEDYAEIYEALSIGMAGQRVTKQCNKRTSARDGVSVKRKWFKEFMAAHGFTWTPTMHIGTGCTVHLTDGELPQGRLVVSLSKHYTSVINNVIRDIYDPRREAHSVRQFPGWETAPLKPGEWRNSNGVCSVSRRCVYGYWVLL